MKTNFLKLSKSALKAVLMLGLAFSLANCSKDDDPVANPEVNPLSAYLSATRFNEATTSVLNGGDYEFGLSFTPTVNGKITGVVVKIPDVNAALRVTIWNKGTATVLKSETINYTTAGVEVTKAIAALNIITNTKYIITFNNNN